MYLSCMRASDLYTSDFCQYCQFPDQKSLRLHEGIILARFSKAYSYTAIKGAQECYTP